MKSKGFQILGPGSKEGGQEPAGSEGAKFRLWVKSKGLTLYPGDENDASSISRKSEEEEDTLYLPTGTQQDSE